MHFRLRNRQTGLMISVTGDLDDVKLIRIQETEETDGLEQIWSYHNGHLHCKVPVTSLYTTVQRGVLCFRRSTGKSSTAVQTLFRHVILNPNRIEIRAGQAMIREKMDFSSAVGTTR